MEQFYNVEHWSRFCPHTIGGSWSSATRNLSTSAYRITINLRVIRRVFVFLYSILMSPMEIWPIYSTNLRIIPSLLVRSQSQLFISPSKISLTGEKCQQFIRKVRWKTSKPLKENSDSGFFPLSLERLIIRSSSPFRFAKHLISLMFITLLIYVYLLLTYYAAHKRAIKSVSVINWIYVKYILCTHKRNNGTNITLRSKKPHKISHPSTNAQHSIAHTHTEKAPNRKLSAYLIRINCVHPVKFCVLRLLI